jgi:hypothetical protein
MPWYFGRTKETLFFDTYGGYGAGNKKYHIRESNFVIGYIGFRFSLCFVVFNYDEEGDTPYTRTEKERSNDG